MAEDKIVVNDRPEQDGPKGIGFFNIKSGETLYARLEPQIQALINSSDMGTNASRGQDFGWRLAPEWVLAIRKFRANEAKMTLLASKVDGQAPTDTHVLYAIYGEQLRKYEQNLADNEKPFEDEYLANIARKPSKN